MNKHPTIRRIAFVLVAMLAAALLLERIAPRQSARAETPAAQIRSTLNIELQGVPDSLALPMDAGQNRIVTVVIRGGTPTAVWAARTAEARYLVSLPPTGEQQYQVNLNDQRCCWHSGARVTTGSSLSLARGGDGHCPERADRVLVKQDATAHYSAVAAAVPLSVRTRTTLGSSRGGRTSCRSRSIHPFPASFPTSISTASVRP